VKRSTVLDVTGVLAWKPSLEFGGPVVKDRVFLEQTGQYYYQTTDINSRPENELRTMNWVSSLTRIDANLSEGESLVVSLGFVPGSVSNATLGTFTPPAATADIDNQFSHSMMTERAQIGGQTFLESMMAFHTFETSVQGKGKATMQLLPNDTSETSSIARTGARRRSSGWKPCPPRARVLSACTPSRQGSTCCVPATRERAPADRFS